MREADASDTTWNQARVPPKQSRTWNPAMVREGFLKDSGFGQREGLGGASGWLSRLSFCSSKQH